MRGAEQAKLCNNPLFKIAGAFVLTAGLLAADTLAGRRTRSRLLVDPDFALILNEQTPDALVISGGCMSDGAQLARQLKPFAAYANLVIPRYPETGFSPHAIFDGLVRTLNKYDLREPSWLGFSMGGMVNAFIQQQYMANQLHLDNSLGLLGIDIKDSSPSNYRRIHPSRRVLLNLATAAHDSQIVYEGKRVFMNHTEKLKRVAATHTSAIAAQHAFMRRFSMQRHELRAAVRAAFYFYDITDPQIDPIGSCIDWSDVYGNVQPVRDLTRPLYSHACGYTYATPLLQVVQNNLTPVNYSQESCDGPKIVWASGLKRAAA